jgi:hypothetical protein
MTVKVSKRTVAENWTYYPIVWEHYPDDAFTTWGQNIKIFDHTVGPFNTLP